MILSFSFLPSVECHGLTVNDPRNRIHLIQVFRHVEASDLAIINLLFKNSKLILCTIKTNSLDEYIFYMSKILMEPFDLE